MSHSTLQELTEAVHGLSPAPSHLASCEDCRELESRLRAELDLLRRADARLEPSAPRRRLGSLLPLAVAAVALLGVIAVILRPGSAPAPEVPALQGKVDVKQTIDFFLDGNEEDSSRARRALIELGPGVLGPLIDARSHHPASIRPDALAALILELKEKGAGEPGVAIFRQLKTFRITVDLQNSPISAVMEYFRQIASLNIFVDPALKSDEVLVSLKVNDVPLHRALDLLGFISPIDYDVRYGVLVIAAPERLFDTPQARAPLAVAALFRRQELSIPGKAALKTLNEMKIDLAFQNTFLSDIVLFIADFSKVNIVLQPGLGEEPITLISKELALGSALELLTLPRGLDLRLEGGTLILFKPKK